MNNLLHKTIRIWITILAIAALSYPTAYAGKGGTTDTCKGPSCVIVDDPIDEPIDTLHTVDLSWTAPTTREDGEPLTLSELQGYRIYIGTNSNDLMPLVDLDNSSITNHSITALNSGTYYFAVTAYDYDGLESAYSEIVSKELL